MSDFPDQKDQSIYVTEEMYRLHQVIIAILITLEEFIEDNPAHIIIEKLQNEINTESENLLNED